MSVSSNVVIMTKDELLAYRNEWFEKGVKRGRFEERCDLSQAKATEGKAGMAGVNGPVRRSTAGTGLRVGAAGADQPATSEHMDVTGGESATTNSGPSDPSSTRSEVTVEELALDLINARRRMTGLGELSAERMKKIGLCPLKEETMFAARATASLEGDAVEKVARIMVRSDPNYCIYHMPSDTPRDWKATSGYRGKTSELSESAAEGVRVRARAILATGLVPDEAAIRADQREIDAKIADEHSFGREIDWWLNATKKDVAAETCRSIAAAIRSGGGE